MHTTSCFFTTFERYSSSPGALVLSIPFTSFLPSGVCGCLNRPAFSRSVDPLDQPSLDRWTLPCEFQTLGDTGGPGCMWPSCSGAGGQDAFLENLLKIWHRVYFLFLKFHLGFLGSQLWQFPCSKLWQAWWLKTTEICSLTVLGIIILKSRCQQGSAVSDAQGRVLLGPSFSFWRPFSLSHVTELWLFQSSLKKPNTERWVLGFVWDEVLFLLCEHNHHSRLCISPCWTVVWKKY